MQRPFRPQQEISKESERLFSRMISSHKEYIWGIIHKHKIKESDQDDVFQMICVLAWRNWPEHEKHKRDNNNPTFPFKYFIAKMGNWAIGNYVKANRSRWKYISLFNPCPNESNDDDFDPVFHSMFAAGEDVNPNLEQTDQLKKAVSDLPEEIRQVFDLYFEGKGSSEIAEVIGSTNTIIQNRYKKGLNMLWERRALYFETKSLPESRPNTVTPLCGKHFRKKHKAIQESSVALPVGVRTGVIS